MCAVTKIQIDEIMLSRLFKCAFEGVALYKKVGDKMLQAVGFWVQFGMLQVVTVWQFAVVSQCSLFHCQKGGRKRATNIFGQCLKGQKRWLVTYFLCSWFWSLVGFHIPKMSKTNVVLNRTQNELYAYLRIGRNTPVAAIQLVNKHMRNSWRNSWN